MCIDIQKKIEEIEETINENKMIDAQIDQLDHKHDINIEKILGLQNHIEKELRNVYEDVVYVDINKKEIKIHMKKSIKFDDLKAIHDILNTQHKNVVLESSIRDEELYIDMIIKIV